MKNVYEQMEEQNARENVAAFLQKQALPYEAKKTAAKQRVLEYYHEMCDVRNANVHVSVGGLDSITLFIFIRDYCHLDVPGISASILEDKSVQAVHKQLGIEDVKPIKSKVAVIKEFGFPILSKEIATKIELLQNPTEDNKTVRHAIITGETGEYGGWQKTLTALAEAVRRLRERKRGRELRQAGFQGVREVLLLPKRETLRRLG